MQLPHDTTEWYLPNPHQFSMGKLVFYKRPFIKTSYSDTTILEALAISNQTWDEAQEAVWPDSPAQQVIDGFVDAGWGDYLLRDFYWCSDDMLPPAFRDLPQPKVKVEEK